MFLEVIPVGFDKFTLEKYALFRNPREIGVMECQFKEDGAVNVSPSMIFIMKDELTNVYYTQFTLETLQAIMSKVGYRIVKKQEKRKTDATTR
jgi:hypothetical protein